MRQFRSVVLGLSLIFATMLPAEDAAAPKPAPAAAIAGIARVTFKLLPMDPNEKDLFVVSNGEFSTSREWEGNGASFAVEIKGVLELQPDGRLVMHFDASLHGEGPDGTGDFHVSTNLLLVPNKEIEAARLGDKTLVVSFSTP